MYRVTTTHFGTRLNGERGPCGTTITHHATRIDADQFAAWRSDHGSQTFPILTVVEPSQLAAPQFHREGRPAPAGYDLTHALCVAAYEWHGGQGSRLYRLGCRLRRRLAVAGMAAPMDCEPPPHLLIWAERVVAPESPFTA